MGNPLLYEDRFISLTFGLNPLLHYYYVYQGSVFVFIFLSLTNKLLLALNKKLLAKLLKMGLHTVCVGQ